jgi:uncharacterized phiE125 gp8 family phage protein
MPAILLIPPSAEPWSVTEAKAFLRVQHDDDDAVIAALIAAARGHVEALSRRALLVQRWRVVIDAWPPSGRLDPRIGPLRSVIAARVYDHNNTAHDVDTVRFVVAAAANVIASPCSALPRPGRAHAGIELDLELGYGASASDVPQPLRHAMRLLVAHWYENRGLAAIGGNVAMLPAGLGALVAPYRMLSL